MGKRSNIELQDKENIEKESEGSLHAQRKQKENAVIFRPEAVSFRMAWPETAGSAAVLAKVRKRGPSVLERLRADKEAVMESGVGRSKRAKVVAAIAEAAPLAVSGGKSRKTGFVLARAVLAESPSGVGVARERQAALVGKQFRKAEAVARETAVGMLATKQVPRRCLQRKLLVLNLVLADVLSIRSWSSTP